LEAVQPTTPNDLAWLVKSSAEAYREEPETVAIGYENDTVVEVRALTRTGLILTEARFDQTERGLRWIAAALAVQ
jgi:hypothetical protein